MVMDQDSDDKLAELQKQVGMLEQQLALFNAQLALDTAKLTQELQLAKAAAEALKSQATVQFELESERAKLPLAELAGVKAALKDMELPTGKTGSVTVAAGTVGTALLRSKRSMLELLDAVAKELSTQLPNGAVIVSEAQLDQAYQANVTLKRIADQTKEVEKAIESVKPRERVAVEMFIPQFAAGAYSLGFVLDTVNSLAKLFRVDRKVDVFAADTEGEQMLGYLLEIRNSNFVPNPAMMRQEVLDEAQKLLEDLTKLLKAIHGGNDVLTHWKKIEDEEAKAKSSVSKLPDADRVADLKTQIEAANSLLDGLHPSKKPDAFWAQVKGQLIWRVLANQDRLLLEVKAQAIQITESRWWRSDRISVSGEVQVAYRILDPNGKVKKIGVMLKASKAEGTSFDEMPELSYQA